MRAVVTGAGGFVGRWLVRHLEEAGDQVVAFDRDLDVTDGGALRQVLADLTPEAVYHLAAQSHVGRSWEEPVEVLRVNCLGTASVLDACRRLASPPRVLVVSSGEVYGAVPAERQPIEEDEPLRPLTPYAASKAAAEAVALQAHRGYGLPVVVARPFNHVGPGQSTAFVVPALAARIVTARARGERTVAVGNLEARRDMTDVRDVVRAYRLLVRRGEPGAVYNVCRGEARTVAEVAERLVALAGADVVLEVDPALVRPVEVPALVGDPSRLVAATGWQPRYELDETLQAVLAEAAAEAPTP
ncbi:GDP-mannose 4,6-dehydratase [Aciditerrimonas ferrireducens]|uniref:GDP-mannose 4,6-dehydratase n=1 Tax=Aciditerrimonas ferrireducens TaxID=667306 RepID=A0ABV6C5L7_9ACTN